MHFYNQNQSVTKSPANDQTNPETEQGIQKSDTFSDGSLPQEKSCLTFKVKIIIGVVVFLVLLGVGLSVGLYFRFRTTIEPISEPTIVKLGDSGIYAIGEYQLTDREIFGNETKVNLILTQGIDFNQKTSSILLESDASQTSDYSYHANLEEIGVQLSVSSGNDLGIRVNLDDLLDHLEKTDPEVARLLSEDGTVLNSSELMSHEEVVSELQSVFAETLSNQVVDSNSVRFKETPIVDLVLNKETKTLEISSNGQAISNSARRMLMIRQLGFLKKLLKPLETVVSAVVKPVVDVIRKNGPLIGGIAGAIVGGVLGGPAGAMSGFQVGSKIGATAQTLVKACVPKDKLTIQCEKNNVISAVKDAVTNKVITAGLTAKCPSSNCKTVVKAVARLF